MDKMYKIFLKNLESVLEQDDIIGAIVTATTAQCISYQAFEARSFFQICLLTLNSKLNCFYCVHCIALNANTKWCHSSIHQISSKCQCKTYEFEDRVYVRLVRHYTQNTAVCRLTFGQNLETTIPLNSENKN